MSLTTLLVLLLALSSFANVTESQKGCFKKGRFFDFIKTLITFTNNVRIIELSATEKWPGEDHDIAFAHMILYNNNNN